MTLIPDPDNPDASKTTSGTSAAEGVVVDAKGNVYGAEVGPRGIKKYVKKDSGLGISTVALSRCIPNP